MDAHCPRLRLTALSQHATVTQPVQMRRSRTVPPCPPNSTRCSHYPCTAPGVAFTSLRRGRCDALRQSTCAPHLSKDGLSGVSLKVGKKPNRTRSKDRSSSRTPWVVEVAGQERQEG